MNSRARRVLAGMQYAIYLALSVAVLLASIRAIRDIHEGGHSTVQLLATAGIAVQVALVALAWRHIVRAHLGEGVSQRTVYRSFILGWLARYIPGPLTLPATKVLEFHRADVEPARAFSAVGSEQWLQFVVCLAVPMLLAPLSWAHPAAWCLPVAGLIILAGAAHPTSGRALHRTTRRLPWNVRVDLIAGRAAVGATALLAGASLSSALAFHFICVGLAGAAPEAVGLSLFAFTLGSFVGFVAPFVPAGAGAREAVIIALMGSVLGHSEVLGAAIVTRGLAVLMDVTLGMGFLALECARGNRLFRSSATFYVRGRMSPAKKRA